MGLVKSTVWCISIAVGSVVNESMGVGESTTQSSTGSGDTKSDVRATVLFICRPGSYCMRP